MKRNKLLIVDDLDKNRDVLKNIFNEQFEFVEALDGDEAIEQIKKYQDELVLILLKLHMPKKSGFDVLEFMNETRLIENIPVILITKDSTIESEVKGYELGASDIIYKPFTPSVVRKRALNIIELYAHRISLENQLETRTLELEESQRKLEKNNDFLINALSSVVEFRSLESGEHIARVKSFTKIILDELRNDCPDCKITDEQAMFIVNASALHDIGKISIPDKILLKPGKLTKSEFEIMKAHTTQGCEILENFKQEEDEFYRYCYDICRYHHERYDGLGYPDGLVGEEIPVWAQIVSIVDVYDALTSKRIYKDAYSAEEAKDMIFNGDCGTFSPRILKCFERALPRILTSKEENTVENEKNRGGGTPMNIISNDTATREDALVTALSKCAGTYYEINVTNGIVMGTPIQFVKSKKYNILDEIGMPYNCSYSDFTNYWADKISPEDKENYLAFRDRENLIKAYEQGKNHLTYTYWTKDVLGNKMFAEQNIILYKNREDGDLLGIVYVKNLRVIEHLKKKEEEARIEAQCVIDEKMRELHRVNQELRKALDEFKRADHDRKRDFLTGLRNRQALYELLNCNDNTKKRDIVAMYMLDIDNFKKLNDRYGHIHGDECLKKIGAALKDYGKENDVMFYRYGGEEMLGIGFSDKKKANVIASELVELVRNQNIASVDANLGVLTTSIGYTTNNTDYKKMIDMADKALYRAKDNGRNCAMCFEECF